MHPILSIVVPTKNRQKYCLATVKQILNLRLDNIEIIIQDNSDENLLQSYIKCLHASNIIYNYTSDVLSFVDNFTKALMLASGDYVCMIGDDDGVLPNIYDVAINAKEKGYDAVIPSLNVVYMWPSTQPIVKNDEDGYLMLASMNRGEKVVENIKNNLIQLLKNGGQNYQQLDIPRLYHGIVSKKALEEVYSVTGKYFDGLTPDIYMATALCFTCHIVCKLNYPVTISGICPKSGSADSATGRHTGKLEDAPHFKGHSTYVWDDIIPSIYSVESIWAETILHALQNFQQYSYRKYFAIDVLDSICFNRYPQFKEIILHHASKYGISLWRLYYLFNLRQCLSLLKRIARKIPKIKKNTKKFTHVQNIEIVTDVVVKMMMKDNII